MVSVPGITEKETLVWSWGPGILEHPHNPTSLENGHILVFDNGTKRGYSRLLELDPRSKEIVWEYHSAQPSSFFSIWGGTAQRLRNGDTLVTDSSEGEVFEIDKAGDIVWEFINPDEGGNGKRVTIYAMTRIMDPRLESILLENVEEDWQW